MAKQKQEPSKKAAKNHDAPEGDDIVVQLIALMDACPTAESLNDRVITPFSVALEKVCLARGYLMNIYGDGSNIVISNPEDSETIYHLIDEYLDRQEPS